MTTLRYFNDPEPITFTIGQDGMPSFAKDGPYLGGKLGENCAWTKGGLDPAHYCEPRFGGDLQSGTVKAEAPTAYASSVARGLPDHPLSAPIAIDVGYFESARIFTETSETTIPPCDLSEPPIVPLPAPAALIMTAIAMLMICQIMQTHRTDP